jgi:hypothetical protein
MPRLSQKINVDCSKASNYKYVADNFYDGAQVAAEYEYWNAAGVLIVHSAIAYGDAITIKFGGFKSKGEDHQALVNLIESITAQSPKKKSALLHLTKLIDQKNAVSYSGDIYKKADIDQMWKHLERFKLWAVDLINN